MRALTNVLVNAVKYGGRARVTLWKAPGSGFVVEIEDEGPGIPDKVVGRVFERFFRFEHPGSQRDGGAGLGLAIAKGFVDAMGGRIAAASPIHDGRGTRILISLPKEKPTPHWLL